MFVIESLSEVESVSDVESVSESESSEDTFVELYSFLYF